MPRDRRPDGRYYETRGSLLSQGDIFYDVPLAYPSPAVEIVLPPEDLPEETARPFLSGPLDFGLAILLTPTCSMRSQSSGREYAHPVRTLAPLRPVEELLEIGVLDTAKRGLAERRDSLINYMWIPEDDELGLENCLALLYMPVTLHHDLIAGTRITQLTRGAASQLQRKLAWYSTSVLLDREDFDPPMD